ncbi:BQ2448_1059 [Microbotryum intermedium]|uniref:BQ2448_1059 protein n=1 Tax=Microbotryum intermedium TaxID=269621 RepID=A0A238F8Y4_9BASI|nr:BQ2448_1059 [Microbotryum intermedium]
MLCKLFLISILSSSSLVALATSAADCTISEPKHAQAAYGCKSITIKAFTMPARQMLFLYLQDGTTINQGELA